MPRKATFLKSLLAVFLGGLAFLALGPVVTLAQGADSSVPPSLRDTNKDDEPKSLKEYLAKQRTEKAKKDHDELIKRGEELMLVTGQLESAFEKNQQLTSSDLSKLEFMEKLVTRIRKGLGGDDDASDDAGSDDDREPSSVKEAFLDLKDKTMKLVDELNKTSRFTISALAIQSSNSVLKIVRFLRLRK